MEYRTVNSNAVEPGDIIRFVPSTKVRPVTVRVTDVWNMEGSQTQVWAFTYNPKAVRPAKGRGYVVPTTVNVAVGS